MDKRVAELPVYETRGGDSLRESAGLIWLILALAGGIATFWIGFFALGQA